MMRKWTAVAWDPTTGADVAPRAGEELKRFWTWKGARKFVDTTNSQLSRGFLPYRLRVEER